MAPPIFGWPIYSDVTDGRAPVFTGGAWESTLPLSNVQDRALHRIARSAGVSEGATRFTVDLRIPCPVRVLAIPYHRTTRGATMRWRCANSESAVTAAPLYDSDWLPMWPTMTEERSRGINFAAFLVLPAAITARVWRCDIRDVLNPRGAIDLGRVIVAGGVQPSNGMNYGAKVGLETETRRSVSDGAAAIYDARPVRRTAEFVVEHLPEEEAMGPLWQMQRIASTHGQLFFVYDPEDPIAQGAERSFLAVLRELRPVEIAYAMRYAQAFGVTEEL